MIARHYCSVPEMINVGVQVQTLQLPTNLSEAITDEFVDSPLHNASLLLQPSRDIHMNDDHSRSHLLNGMEDDGMSHSAPGRLQPNVERRRIIVFS